ncbi:MAG: mechanosensitive ion channel domain-containing protein [Patescibacteria group bacterium]|nr:mechanosensitive ion channel family protein [Patescibacteria group bacterium]
MTDFFLQNEYLRFFLILFGSLLAAKIFLFILRKYAIRIAEKTRTDLDDMILKIIEMPMFVLFVLGGLYFALASFAELKPYAQSVNKIFFVVLTLIISIMVSRIASLLIGRWFKVKNGHENAPRLINKIAAIAIYLIALLMILGYFEIEITPLIATLGLGGLAVGLALQNTLLNFFSGLHIISDKPFNVGDFVELEGGVSGFIEDIGWRSTRIKTMANNIVIIPNSKLAESVITNNFLPEKEMGVLVQCGVGYGSNLEKVEKVTIDVAGKIQKTVPGAVKDFEPFMRYYAFGDSNIDFSIILRVETFTGKYLITHELIKALKKRYDEENIEISWPVRKIYYGK